MLGRIGFTKSTEDNTHTHTTTVRNYSVCVSEGGGQLPPKSPVTGWVKRPLSVSPERRPGESLEEEAACEHAAGVFLLKQQEERDLLSASCFN